MLKILMVAVFSLFMLDSGVAIGADMVTVEKWLCTKDAMQRTLRLYAESKGDAPCKVFYSKRTAEDPNDVQTEADQNSGKIRPIYYSTGNGGFCVRKMDEFRGEREKQGWNCSKLI